ncbi:uncharacterized protein LOC119836791 isoform X2 [Zerene cesonia]|uniref:uncharacterized protein LOC119836791 isoform X2 n=1 Tax=Zerene cesonia TaxID=33412 RepID=UPI0018E53737|nr:uncharacterized protein LOC119836791 isoform X2 [Zerene cesonia]
MQASPKPMKGLDPYRMRQRPLTVEEIAEIAAHLHIAHLTELQRLRDFQRRFQWPQDSASLSSRLDHLPQPLVTWRPVVVPRNLQELFDTVPKSGSAGAAGGAGGAGGAGSAAAAAESAGAWRAARGWAAGALLLLAALFLVRATDRFFTKNYLRWRRSRSEEWPTPNVLATSHRSTFVDMELPPNELEPIPSESSGSSQELYTNDLPPPYSECSTSANKHKYEEPPPPYSACYVEFSNPKDGIPAVHFLNSQRENIFQDLDAGTSRNDANTSSDASVRSDVSENDTTVRNETLNDTGQASSSNERENGEVNVGGNSSSENIRAGSSKVTEVC